MNIPLKQYISLLAKYLKPQWLRVGALAAVLLATIGLQLLNPQIVRRFIDAATIGSALEPLLWAAASFLGVALITQLLQVLATYLGENVGWTATNMLRVDLSYHCLHLDMPFHKSHTPGEMIERIDGDVTAISRFFSQFVIQVLANVVLIFGVLVVLFLEDWRLGAALGVFALVSMVVLSKTRNLPVPALTAERQANADLYGFLEERLAGLPDIRANGAGAHVMRGLHKAQRALYKTGRHVWKVEAWMWLITVGLFTAGTIIALSAGVSLFGAGAISLGTVYLLYQYTEMLRRPLEQISDQLRDLQKASAGIGRVQQLYDTPIDIEDGPGVAFPGGPLSVEFGSVSFGYDGDEPVIEGLTFLLRPGRVLGLLGRTGSGKTTLTRLLFRLYDPSEGAIRLGGHDIRLATLEDLRRHIGMVTQDVQLFAASVRDNLTLFDNRIADERIVEVVQDLGLGAWFAGLPDGLDTPLGTGGAGLSAGQAQLLAFARVFLKDPGLVILDEASSRLDPVTEMLIERAVDKLLAGRTGIIIAHRLGTVQRADEILVLEDGKLLEHGPRALLAADPTSRFAHLLATGLEQVLV